MKSLLIIVFSLFSLTTIAGPGSGHSHSHSNEVSQVRTVIIAQEHIKRLIAKGKLESSWSKADYEESVQKKFGNKKEWVVTFKNTQVSENQKLYVFLSLGGDFIAANFTGK